LQQKAKREMGSLSHESFLAQLVVAPQWVKRWDMDVCQSFRLRILSPVGRL
jgi:hypothetical protein